MWLDSLGPNVNHGIAAEQFSFASQSVVNSCGGRDSGSKNRDPLVMNPNCHQARARVHADRGSRDVGGVRRKKDKNRSSRAANTVERTKKRGDWVRKG